ncbi:hypothetical protein HELRODRAFT_169142 [Helobdella robusta]|uniref:Endonuclease/exonuclease/phosphatase domain-containing protein n=1 Tax=Helobdella robusta TaxID=6412 RepID=T1F1G5_HELRO|nr:hypothetical protein HELRODRAFT_169142 [Helobdella robusta]ESO08332.1 hypothetical protein HELRODRAFT_169142 [Helobdella robusta]
MVKVITLSNNNLDKLLDESDANLSKIIEQSNDNLRKSLAHSEKIMSQLFETTFLRIESLSNSFERAVKSMSNALTDSMTQLHATLSTLGNSVSARQQQVTKLNETPMFETMTRALWNVEQERKDDEQRSNNIIISELELEQGGNDKDMVSSICENHLPIKPQIVRTRLIGKSKLCVTLSNLSATEDLIASSKILRSSPATKNIYCNPDLSKRQAEKAFLKRQKRRPNKANNKQPADDHGGFDVSAKQYAFDSVGCIKELCKGGVVCLMGDINLPHINWASSRARLITRCFISKDKGLLIKAFYTYVRPLVEYASSVWNPHYKYQITKLKVYREDLRNLFRLYIISHTCLDCMRLEWIFWSVVG